MAGGNIHAALQHRDVLRGERPLGLRAEKTIDAACDQGDVRRFEVGARHLVDVDDERRQRLQPREKRIVVQELQKLRRLHRRDAERLVVFRGVDQRAMQWEERLRDLAQRAAQNGPLRRVGRVHRSRVEGVFVEWHGPQTSRLHGWLGKGG
jgi:hypothetical protein